MFELYGRLSDVAVDITKNQKKNTN